jgi:hypothetical protein
MNYIDTITIGIAKHFMLIKVKRADGTSRIYRREVYTPAFYRAIQLYWIGKEVAMLVDYWSQDQHAVEFAKLVMRIPFRKGY